MDFPFHEEQNVDVENVIAELKERDDVLSRAASVALAEQHRIAIMYHEMLNETSLEMMPKTIGGIPILSPEQLPGHARYMRERQEATSRELIEARRKIMGLEGAMSKAELLLWVTASQVPATWPAPTLERVLVELVKGEAKAMNVVTGQTARGMCESRGALPGGAEVTRWARLP